MKLLMAIFCALSMQCTAYASPAVSSAAQINPVILPAADCSQATTELISKFAAALGGKAGATTYLGLSDDQETFQFGTPVTIDTASSDGESIVLNFKITYSTEMAHGMICTVPVGVTTTK